MGKDNIVFHTVIWPAMLLGLRRRAASSAPGAAPLELPDDVVATEFLTMEGKQFSTSRGVVIYVRDFLGRYDPDPLRYYLSIAGPETQDTDFTWAEFVRRNNDELRRELGQPRQPHAHERAPQLRRGARAGRADRAPTEALLADDRGRASRRSARCSSARASGRRSRGDAALVARSTSTSATRRRGRS